MCYQIIAALKMRLLIEMRLLVALLLIVLFATACGDDVFVEESVPFVGGALELPYDAQKVDVGSAEYEIHCLYCHGVEGDGKTDIDIDRAVVPSALAPTSYVTAEAIAEDKLKIYTQDYMPAYASGVSPSDCDDVCAENIQYYFYWLWSQNEATSASAGESSEGVSRQILRHHL